MTSTLLLVINYKNESGIQEELRIKKKIAPKWGDLATTLKFSEAEKDIIDNNNFHKADRCTDNMLKDWMTKEVNYTWRKLIQAMRKVELRDAAEKLAKALRNKVN